MRGVCPRLPKQEDILISVFYVARVWKKSNSRPLTMPANWETSRQKAISAAHIPVATVLLMGTCVRLFTSEKKDGSKPSLAIAINILGWESMNRKVNVIKLKNIIQIYAFKKIHRRL